MLKGVLLDLGGVVYAGDALLPGARESLARLHAAGLPVRFVTNVTRQSRRQLLDMLAGMGLAVDPDTLFMPATAARDHLAAHGLSPHLLVHPALTGEFAGLPPGERRAVVVGDAGDGFTYGALNAAFRELADGAPLLALARNRYFRDADGGLSLDAGAFVAALEYASGEQAIVLGKPAPDFFRAAVASLGCAPDETVMVGDDAEADIAGAIDAGLSGVLVQTGKYRPGAEHAVTPAPTATVADLAAAVDWILENRG